MKPEDLQKVVDEEYNTPEPPKWDMKNEECIRHHFRHFPDKIKELAIDYLINENDESLDDLIKGVLAKFSPLSDSEENRPDFDSLTLDHEIINDFGMDSLSLMEIAFFCEEVFSLRIENEKIMHIVTLRDVTDMIRQTKAEQDGVEVPEMHFGGAEDQNPGPDDPPLAHKKYKIGWVPNPKNPTAFLECTKPVPVVDMNDPETVKKLQKAAKNGELEGDKYQEFLERELTPKKKKRKYTKRSEYWNKKKNEKEKGK